MDVVWAVDGTGSYKTYIEDAKNNFKARVACIQHYVMYQASEFAEKILNNPS